jgi:hypothetical protein
MRWKDETQKLSITMELWRAMDIVTDAYSEGFIGQKHYELAIDRIKRHMNKYLFIYPKDEGVNKNGKHCKARRN